MKNRQRRIVIFILSLAMLLTSCSSRLGNEGPTASPETTPQVAATSLPPDTPAPSQEPDETGAATSSATPGFVGKATGGIARDAQRKAPDRESLTVGDGLHKYNMDLELDEDGKLLTGTIRIEYNNDTGTDLDSIPFHVYPKTFASEDTAPFFHTEMSQAYPNGFSKGDIDISAAAVDGEDVEFGFENDDSTLMVLKLPEPLQKDSQAVVEMEFTVTLPNSLGRFGYGNKTYNLCNFYPIACAWDGDDFYTYPYYIAGDPFVSDVSDYEVTFKVPEGMVVAYTGHGESETDNGVTTYTITAPMVRDFALVASRHFKISEKKVNGISVRSYYFSNFSKAGYTAMEAGADAIKIFGDSFGQYPYDDYCIVQTDFFIGGMEYPGLVMIDQSSYNVALGLEYVVVHETAHQWWYGVIGNDQVMEPWLDEALSEYSSFLYFGEAYGEDVEENMFGLMVEVPADSYEEMYGSDAKGVSEPMKNFDNMMEYSYCIYTKGNLMLRDVEARIGRANMKKALSAYYEQNMFNISCRETLINTFNKESNTDLTDIFNKWLK